MTVRFTQPSRRFAFWLALVSALAIAFVVYRAGLRGVFVFDDYANLPALGAFGPVDNWTAFWRYITSGTADPTGRPLALLSFLIDAHNWPADPYPFKCTSLVLHLINGLLLALLLRRLGRALRVPPARADLAAALAASMWLLHPLFVSTTLYVVQREAMLPATFVLLGLLTYCRGHTLANQGRRGGVWVAAAAIIVFTPLGVASKANGILLPLLAWLVDALVLEPGHSMPSPVRVRFNWMRRIVVVLPSVMILAGLVVKAIQFAPLGILPFRSWTLFERLLTEARVVCQYLYLLWIPHPYTAGVFNDAVATSTGLLSPPSTLAAIAFIAALLVLAAAVRRQAPALALAILFYFAGHLLESTVIPLELYYEHRNYLPAMPMFWPLALWLTGDGRLPAVRRALAVLFPLLLAGMTALRADLWGDAQGQALMWAELNPQSPRAQAYAAAAERARGRPDLADARMRRVRVDAAEEIQIALNEVGAQCQLGNVTPTALDRARKALRSSRTAGRLYFEWMSGAIGRIAKGNACNGLGPDEIRSLIAAMDENPKTQLRGGWRQDNFGLQGALSLALHQPHQALEYFNHALDADPRPEAALSQAAQLGSAGYPAEGLEHLDHYAALPNKPISWSWSMASIHALLLRRQGFLQDEIAHLRSILEQDVRNAAAKAAADKS